MQIYLAAFFFDVIIFFITFVVMYRAGESHLSNGLCTLLGLAGPCGYVFTSFASGKIVNQDNCRWLLLLSTVLGVLCCVAILFSQAFIIILVLLFVFGLCNGLYFNAFQSFIRNISVRGEIVKTICLYTLAWSSGVSFGFLISGSLYKLGPYVLSLILMISGIIILVIIKKKEPAVPGNGKETYPFSTNPMFLWIGWIMIFTVTFIERAIQVFFPVLSAKSSISPFFAGLPLFLMTLIQGTAVFLFIKYKNLLYKKSVVLIVHTIALFIFLILWKIPSYLSYVICFALIGFYGAFAYFSAILYANNHFENRSFNVGINETIVGISSIIGVIISYFWMKYFPGAGSMYFGCSLVLLIAIIVMGLLPMTQRAQS